MLKKVFVLFCIIIGLSMSKVFAKTNVDKVNIEKIWVHKKFNSITNCEMKAFHEKMIEIDWPVPGKDIKDSNIKIHRDFTVGISTSDSCDQPVYCIGLYFNIYKSDIAKANELGYSEVNKKDVDIAKKKRYSQLNVIETELEGNVTITLTTELGGSGCSADWWLKLTSDIEDDNIMVRYTVEGDGPSGNCAAYFYVRPGRIVLKGLKKGLYKVYYPNEDILNTKIFIRQEKGLSGVEQRLINDVVAKGSDLCNGYDLSKAIVLLGEKAYDELEPSFKLVLDKCPEVFLGVVSHTPYDPSKEGLYNKFNELLENYKDDIKRAKTIEKSIDLVEKVRLHHYQKKLESFRKKRD